MTTTTTTKKNIRASTLRISTNPLRIQVDRDPAKAVIRQVVLDGPSEARLHRVKAWYAERGGRAASQSVVLRRGLELIERELEEAQTIEAEALALAGLVKHIGSHR
jgi:hypothetical protein